MLTSEDICIRDPFLLPVPEEHCYYLYGSVGADENGVPHWLAFRTADLVHFEEPDEIFRAGDGFWADRDFWAPEVHLYNGKYYLFASCKADGKCRGTQIFVCDTPNGRFVPLTAEPVTPRDWECLDGTLFVDEQKNPYIVFCHEWVQVKDGEMCCMPLSADLTHAVGASVCLFRASEAPIAPKGKETYVTDGPFLFRDRDGNLCMIWSTFAEATGYAEVLAYSESGLVTGPWKQSETPVYTANGGHGMLFCDFDGQDNLVLHAPNSGAPEHLHVIPVTIGTRSVSIPVTV